MEWISLEKRLENLEASNPNLSEVLGSCFCEHFRQDAKQLPPMGLLAAGGVSHHKNL